MYHSGQGLGETAKTRSARCPRLVELPVEQRVGAFHLARELKSRNFTTVGIFNQFHRNGTAIKYETIRSWVTGKRNPLRKLNFVTAFDGDLVELVGMAVGDGSWHKVLKGKSYDSARLSYASKDLELATRAGELMAKVMGKPRPYRPYWSTANGVYVAECTSKNLVEILQEALARFSDLIRRHQIRFLRGVYDAEGCITVRKRRGRIYPRIYLSNSDSEILDLTRSLLEAIGIRTTIEMNTKAGREKTILEVETRTNKNVYNICIGTRQNVLVFAHKIGFGVGRKDALLRKTVRWIERMES